MTKLSLSSFLSSSSSSLLAFSNYCSDLLWLVNYMNRQVMIGLIMSDISQKLGSSFWPLPRYLSRLSLESFETGQTGSLIRNEYKWTCKILTLLLEWYTSNIQQFDEKRIWSLYRRFQVWGRWFTIKTSHLHKTPQRATQISMQLQRTPQNHWFHIGFYEIWSNLCILISPEIVSQAGGTHDVDRTLAMSGLLSEATRGHETWEFENSTHPNSN